MSVRKLTPAEWEIMEAVWKLGGSPSVRDVLEYAFPKGVKAYTTVQTVMNMIEKKVLLKKNKIGLVNFYTPLRTRDRMVKNEMVTVVSMIFAGSVPTLANFPINSQNLTLDEIRGIKKILELKERKLKGEG